jgi:hypothetical protein
MAGPRRRWLEGVAAGFAVPVVLAGPALSIGISLKSQAILVLVFGGGIAATIPLLALYWRRRGGPPQLFGFLATVIPCGLLVGFMVSLLGMFGGAG